jgi:hypothetical protein
MALDDFWQNAKIAASLVEPRVNADSSGLDPAHLHRLMRNAVIWLTPATVAGFDPCDFTFLSPSEREELKTSVGDFRRVAETVPDDGPATKEQIQEALPKLRRILEILRPDLNPDVDAFRAAKVLENLRLPYDVRDDVARFIHEFDTDSTGDPGVWVWVILKDEAAEGPGFFEKAERIRQFVDLALLRQGVRLRPYIHFRTVSEQRELDRGRRK